MTLTNSKKILPKANINYYINWKYWQYLYPGLDKSKYDLVYFTHFEEGDNTDILDSADCIVAMSEHGKKCLIEKGISENKIRVSKGMGAKSGIAKRKVKLGISGRPYSKTGRKGEADLIRLSGDVDSNIFQFIFLGAHWQPIIEKMGGDCIIKENGFWESIDYWLSTSVTEGGPMDIINAFHASIPVISRNIGFFYSIKSCEDFVYDDYGDLLVYLKNIERGKIDKIRECQALNWDDFRKWHIDLFKNIVKGE